jgi:hypothetical protein
LFAELKYPVRHKIERYGLTGTIDPRHFFPTIESAVATFHRETGGERAIASPSPPGPENHPSQGEAIPRLHGKPGG